MEPESGAKSELMDNLKFVTKNADYYFSVIYLTDWRVLHWQYLPILMAINSTTYHPNLSMCPKSRIVTFTFIELHHHGAFYSYKYQCKIKYNVNGDKFFLGYLVPD